MKKESLIDQYPFCESFFWDASVLKLNSPEFSSFSKIAAIRIQDRKQWYFSLKAAEEKSIEIDPSEEIGSVESIPEPKVGLESNLATIIETPQKEVIPIEITEPTEIESIENEQKLELESLEKEYLAQNYSIENFLPIDNSTALEVEPINPPQSVPPKSKQSFTAWMNEIALADSNPKQKKQSVVEMFLAQEGSSLKKPNFFSASTLAKASLEEHEDFITPTLAGIYEKQGNYSKATEAYKKLALKFPEKSSYFAALILKIEQKQKKK